jgi:hypothetical protein
MVFPLINFTYPFKHRQGDSAKGEYEIFMVQDVMRIADSGGIHVGEECKYNRDGLCEGSLECGRAKDDIYTCCEDTFVLGFTDVCSGVIKEGERCPSTRDASCEGSLECGKRSKSDETYICCKDTYVPWFWITDVCK